MPCGTGITPYLRGTQRREPSLSDEKTHRRFGRRARVGAVSAVTLAAAAAGAFGATAASAAPARPSCDCSAPSVTSAPFGSTFDSYANKNLPVSRFTLKSGNGVTANILSYGG